jgi:FlaA1/EpsC-like NDP-sugar epimerase
LTAVKRAVAETRVLEPATHVSEGVKPGWTRSYIRRLAVTDAVAILASITIAQLVRFGADPATLRSEVLVYSYTAVSAVLILVWSSALILFRSRETRVVGTGVEEFRRVARASMTLFGTVAIISFLFKLEVARGYLAVALPLGAVSLLLTRWLWRKWLANQRAEGRCISTVLVVGSHHAASAMAQEFERVPAAGYRVAGVCVPGWGTGKGDTLNVDGHAVPVLGDETAVIDALRATDANMVAVSNTEYLGADRIRALQVDRWLSPLVRPGIRHTARKLWLHDLAYADRRFELRRRGEFPG